MYKRITHTIVEEHFDQPVTWKYPQRYYGDGSVIPYKLPQSYQTSTNDSRCENCLARDPMTNYCSQWDAVVRPEYVCDAWTPM